MPPPQRLKGMEDRGAARVRVLRRASDALEASLASYGYQPVDTPVLEETELFLRKSGGELASKMYTFTDPGGNRVSLRPEFTASVVRAYLQAATDEPSPVRWRYVGPVFRYEGDAGTERRQFTQVGAELLGASGPWADAEVAAVAWKGLARLGLRRHRLVIGHMGFVASLLDSLGLSDRARILLLGNIGTLSRDSSGVAEVRQHAMELGVFGSKDQSGEPSQQAQEALAVLERSIQSGPAITFGVRTAEEVRERFWRKQRMGQGSAHVGEALQLLAQVAQVRGEPGQALRAVRPMVADAAAHRELDSLAQAIEALDHYGVSSSVSLDFGLARGIAYYTGIVFELQHDGVPGGSLGGGGRYDGLVHALDQAQGQSQGSGRNVPALGFAWTVERVAAALAAEGHVEDSGEPVTLLVRAEGPSAMAAAVGEAERLRERGERVELDVSSHSLAESLDYARRRGIARVLTVDSAGGAKGKNVPKRARESATRRS